MGAVLAFLALLFAGALVVGLVRSVVGAMTAKSIEARIMREREFAARDLLVSPTSRTGVAIDLHRKEILLADAQTNRRYRAHDIVGCEILLDGAEVSYANRASQVAGMAVGGLLLGGAGAVIGGLSGSRRSSNNVRKIVLRIAVEDFDRPYHNIVLLDYSFSKKGLSRDSRVVQKALANAETWHGRTVSLMRAADQTGTAANPLAALASALPQRLDQPQHARGHSESPDPRALSAGKPVSWVDAHRGAVVAGVLAFFGLAVIAIVNSATNSQSASSNASSVTNGGAVTLTRKQKLENISIENLKWSKEGFGSVMVASFVISNNNPAPIKDVQVTCVHAADSGTVIDRNTRTIFERIESGSYFYVRDLNMGFIHSQAVQSRCYVSDFVG